MYTYLVSLVLLVLLGAGCLREMPEPQVRQEEVAEVASAIGFPIGRAMERVTKKPFGLRVTQKNSPVQPERFSGYHVGVDFETFDDEQDRDVAIVAICDGTLALKRIADGYGGVAVQYCEIENKPVTVVYGHMRLASIPFKVGDAVQRGETLGVLGTGYSSETDGERKHLHLGIHEGTEITIRGYVQTEAEMRRWLDARLSFPL